MSSGPSLTLPSSEQFTSDGTIAITGANYSDNFAAGNPGAMYLAISDTSGDLYGYHPTSGSVPSADPAPGNGTETIVFQGSYADVTDIINSLTYAATAATGTDDIHFDIWNQAGVETTGDIPVTIGATGTVDTWNGNVSSDWNTGANWSAGVPPTSGDSVVIPAGTAFNASLTNATLNGETITVSGSATVNFTDVTFNSILQSADTGNVDISGTLTIGAQGTLGPQPGCSLFVDSLSSAVPIINDGVIEAPSASLLTFDNGGTVISATASIVNNGVISANGGAVSFDFAPPPFGHAPPETLTNGGSISVGNGGDLTLNGTFVGNDVAFVGSGALSLQVPDAFAGGSTITGFGPGDEIDLYGTAQGTPLGYANGVLTAGTAAAIPLAGSFGIGNFESEFTGGSGNAQSIAFAPDGGPSGVVHPDITAPASSTVAQGATLSLGDVSIGGSVTVQDTMSISAGSGTLFMDGATGSGTNQLSFGPTPQSQLDADLASLTYVPAVGATSDTVQIEVSPPAPVTTSREIAITITPGSSGPLLNEPSGETISPGGTVAVSGSYSDSFAQSNPGELYVGISDSTGTLTATNAAGAPVAGSVTNSIGLSADYVDVNAILASLHYTAGSASGSDTIQFQVWNQAGADTTGSTRVMINPPVTGAMTQADFAAPVPSHTVTENSIGGPASLAMFDNASIHLVPMTFGH